VKLFSTTAAVLSTAELSGLHTCISELLEFCYVVEYSNIIYFIILLDARLQLNIGSTLRHVLAMFTHSVIT